MDQPSRGLSAATAAPPPPGLQPPLAVRAGVDAAGTEAGQVVGQQPGKWQKREKRRPPPRPTHFLALQVGWAAALPAPRVLALSRRHARRSFPRIVRPGTQVSQSEAVAGAIAAVQAALRAHSPHLSKACVEAASAHLTLGVMALPGEDARAAACRQLEELGAALEAQALRAPLEVSLEGLSHFNNQVSGRGRWLSARSPGCWPVLRLPACTLHVVCALHAA